MIILWSVVTWSAVRSVRILGCPTELARVITAVSRALLADHPAAILVKAPISVRAPISVKVKADHRVFANRMKKGSSHQIGRSVPEDIHQLRLQLKAKAVAKAVKQAWIDR